MQYIASTGNCIIGKINHSLGDDTTDEIAEVYINEDARMQLSDVISKPPITSTTTTTYEPTSTSTVAPSIAGNLCVGTFNNKAKIQESLPRCGYWLCRLPL